MEELIYENLNEEFHLTCSNKWDNLRKVTGKVNQGKEEHSEKMEELIFENLNEEFHLSCSNKWDILRKITKKVNQEDEPTEESKQKADLGFQLLPRQDVLLFGMLPKMEQRVYSKCKECRIIFNPRDILKHKNCTAKPYQETIHPSLLKKQQKQLAKAKANVSKKPASGTTSVLPPQNLPLFKKPRTPPPIKPKSSISRPSSVPSPLSAPNPLLELKVSVAKVVLPRIPKVSTVTSSTSSTTLTMTTSSSEKHHDVRMSSSSASSAVSKSTSGHVSPKSPSKSSSHSSSHSCSSHRSSSSKESHKSSSRSSGTPDSHTSRSVSKSSPGESHSSKSASKTTSAESQHHLSSKPSKTSTSNDSSHSSTHSVSSRSVSKTIPMDTSSHSKGSSHSESHSSSRKSSTTSSTPMDTLPPPSRSTVSSSTHHHSSRHSTDSRSSSTSSSSSRHKKSKKSNSSSSSTSTSPSSASTSSKGIVYDPDVHCGVVEGTKGPCTRSVTCSNHRIQLRKLVPGRSKDIHQLIAERKAAKEKDSKHTSSSYAVPNAEAKDSTGQNTSYVLIVTKIVSTAGTTESPATLTTSYVPIMPKVPVGLHSRPLTTSKMSEPVEKEADSPRTILNGYVNQTTFDTSPQDVYMPMSPISVASPVQFVKIGNKMMCLETPQSAKTPPITKSNPIFIQMPMNQPPPNIRTYKSHPKPAKVLTYGTRKMGGAILFSNRRLESQRNAFLSKLRPHVNKTVNKRPASEKLVTSECKKMVSEVNGFFLHVDMSDASDNTQSNNIIQDKILLSMK